jgi:hypothetical protein
MTMKGILEWIGSALFLLAWIVVAIVSMPVCFIMMLIDWLRGKDK